MDIVYVRLLWVYLEQVVFLCVYSFFLIRNSYFEVPLVPVFLWNLNVANNQYSSSINVLFVSGFVFTRSEE